MSVSGWLLIYVSLIISVLSVQVVGTNCGQPDRFGTDCKFRCHCSEDCDKVFGTCPGGCIPPWSGATCQQKNIAKGMRTNASGYFLLYPQWTSEKTVDGNRNSDIYSNTCFHSDHVEKPLGGNQAVWLQIDLGRPHRTYFMVWWLRQFHVMSARAHQALIFVTNTPDITGEPCFKTPYPYQSFVTIKCDRVGRYVTLYQNSSMFYEGRNLLVLEVCEFEVNECTNGTYGKTCQEFCYCNHNAACHVQTGKCPDGCQKGYTGDTCSTVELQTTGKSGIKAGLIALNIILLVLLLAVVFLILRLRKKVQQQLTNESPNEPAM